MKFYGRKLGKQRPNTSAWDSFSTKALSSVPRVSPIVKEALDAQEAMVDTKGLPDKEIVQYCVGKQPEADEICIVVETQEKISSKLDIVPIISMQEELSNSMGNEVNSVLLLETKFEDPVLVDLYEQFHTTVSKKSTNRASRMTILQPVSLVQKKISTRRIPKQYIISNDSSKFSQSRREDLTLAMNSSTTRTYSKQDSVVVRGDPIEEQIEDTVLSEDEKVDEGLESSEEGKGGLIRGIHQLKQAGNFKRDLDEIEYLTEGIHSKNISIQRSACLDLIYKLQKDTTTFRIHGKIDVIFKALEASGDDIVQTSLYFILRLLSRDMRCIVSLNPNKLCDWLIASIESILGRRKTNVKNLKKSETSRMKELVALMGCGTEDTILELLAALVPTLSKSVTPGPILISYLNLKLSVGAPVSILTICTCISKESPAHFSSSDTITSLWQGAYRAFGTYYLILEDALFDDLDLEKCQTFFNLLLVLHSSNIPLESAEPAIVYLLRYIAITENLMTNRKFFNLQIMLLELTGVLIERSKNLAQKVRDLSCSLMCSLTCRSKCECKTLVDGLKMLVSIFQRLELKFEEDSTVRMRSAVLANLIGYIMKHHPESKREIPTESFVNLIMLLKELLMCQRKAYELTALDEDLLKITSLENLIAAIN